MIQQNPSLSNDTPAYFLIIKDDQILQYGSEPGVIFKSWSELHFLHQYRDTLIEVGTYDDVPCYVVDVGAESLQQDVLEGVSIRSMLLQLPRDFFGIVSRAWQVALFLRTHRFCGQCGSTMHNVGWELAMNCNNCGHRCYPRISPCIIVAIRRGQEILLAQGRHHKGDLYSTLAGFVESGESLEEAVHREVFEEVGVKVKSLEYFASQPWPFPHSLMCGFLAEWESGDIVIDEKEIAKADWFDINQLPVIPPKFSIAGQLISATIDKIGESESASD